MYFGPHLRIESWMFEIVLYLFFILVFWAGTKIIGREKTSLFLWGSLSNLEYTLRLTNMETGVTRTYHNPPGKFCGGLDNNAF